MIHYYYYYYYYTSRGRAWRGGGGGRRSGGCGGDARHRVGDGHGNLGQRLGGADLAVEAVVGGGGGVGGAVGQTAGGSVLVQQVAGSLGVLEDRTCRERVE